MRLRSLAIAALGLLNACTTSWWTESADREVSAVIAEKRAAFEAFREKELIRPDRDVAEAGEKKEEDLSGVPKVVDLKAALEIATARNRDYISEKESLYLSALSLTGARNSFSPIFSGTLSSVLSDTNTSSGSRRNSANLGMSKILRSGGTFSAGASGSANASGAKGTGGADFSSDWSVDLTQPLLRGAGYETSHESLTQAERNVVYAIRDFELFREDFTIQVTSRYYSLVRQLREIENADRNLKARHFLKRQSEAKFEVGLATEVDKLRSAREYLRAQNDLLELRESYQLALDRFKIQLGLPTSFPLTIRPQEPLYREVKVELKRAVQAALHNRLDLITSRDRFEDSERDLRIQVNRMLPDLDFSAGFARSAPSTGSISNQAFKNASYTLGLTLELPLERKSERNALRRAIIDLERSRRSLSLQEDNVILEVRDSIRQLRRTETSIGIRKEEIRAADKEARAAQIRFEEGRMDNRNVTDAQNAVLSAENAYIRTLVDYEVARIQLLRDVGILFIDENGMWVEP